MGEMGIQLSFYPDQNGHYFMKYLLLMMYVYYSTMGKQEITILND